MPHDYKIYPVKFDKSKLGEIDMGEILPPIPHLILCTGHVKSGKSQMYNSLYMSNEFYKNKFDVKILLSPTASADAINEHLIKEFDYFFEDVNEELIKHLLDMIENDESDNNYLMVFDDIIGTLPQKRNGKPDLVSGLATKYRHVKNKNGKEGRLSIFIATQHYKSLTKLLRANSSAYLIMGHLGEEDVKSMGKELSYFGGSIKEFLNIYKRSRKQQKDFLFLNVNKLSAYRNFEELLFCEKDLFKNEEK